MKSKWNEPKTQANYPQKEPPSILLGIPVTSLKLLTGGANNRVYLLNEKYILKEYFQHPNDPRARLETEYNFLTFAYEQGLRQVPKPLTRDQKQALYTKVPGNLASYASPKLLIQALSFFLELNVHKKKASHLPPASDAALSPCLALDAVEKRLNKLEKALPEFTQKLRTLHQKIGSWSDTLLSSSELCLSPSDFGLHNILVDGDKAYFLDFEYAGWDDPAKMLCDFFTSPRIPIPKDLFWTFAKAIAETLPDPNAFYKRLQLHFPLSQIKWCCIILNIFSKTDEERRNFSASGYKKETQLEKAELYINQFSMEIPYGLS